MSTPNTQNDKNILTVKAFQKDSYSLFIYKKTERISAAFYLLSNFFPNEEPIKWRVRKLCVLLIEDLLSAEGVSSDLEHTNRFASNYFQLLSILDIAYTASLISEMNYKVISAELENILNLLNDRKPTGAPEAGSTQVFGRDFFSISPEQLVSSNDVETEKRSLVKRVFPGARSGQDDLISVWSDLGKFKLSKLKGSYKGQKSLKDNISSDSLTEDMKNQKEHARGLASISRQSGILDMLKGGAALSINDFAQTIKGCSIKTIQRELSKLVTDGVLKKEGERRWSRYSFKLL